MEDELGYEVRVTETFRTQSRQDALFAQGRTAPGPTVTWTRSSNHTKGLAADIVIEGGDDAAYAKLAKVAAEEGLRTLGPDDPGHIELVSPRPAGSRRAAAGTRSAATGLMARTAMPAAVATVARSAQVAQVAVPGAAIAVPQSDGYRPGANVRAAVLAETRVQTSPSDSGRRGEAVRNAALAIAGAHSTGQGRTDGTRSTIGRSATAGAPRADAQGVGGETVTAREALVAPPATGAGSNASNPVLPADASAIAFAVAHAAQPNGRARPVHPRELRQAPIRGLTGGGGEAGAATTSEESGPRGHADPRIVRPPAGSPETGSGSNPGSGRGAGVGRGTDDTAGPYSTTIEPDGFTDMRAATTPNTAGATGLANAAEAVAGAGGPDIQSRVARLLALQDAQRSAPATGVTLEVGPDDGLTAAKIRVGVRGGAIDALIDVADPAIANRLGGRVDELRRALERTGLEPATVLVRELGAGVQPGRGASAGQNQTDPETGRQGWLRRDPGNPENQKQGRRNSKESQR
jgi:hypothetical protein